MDRRIGIKKGFASIRLPAFFVDRARFLSRVGEDDRGMRASFLDSYPCLDDKSVSMDHPRDYLYHVGWAARRLAAIMPAKHVDISSSIWFATVVSAFIEVDYYEYRPAGISLPSLTEKKGDLLRLQLDDGSVPSLSCMHVIEHVGLGRYGDEIDPNGDRKAAKELARVLAPGGDFLFVAPVGKPRIEFNAHRIYSYRMVLDLFPGLEVVETALLPGAGGGLVENAGAEEMDREEYGCGCFWLRKGR
jgi:SAM-dependent methyltransferase